MPRPFTDPGRRCGCRRTGSTQRGAEPPNAACDRGGHYGCCSAGAGASAGRGGRRSVGPRSAPAVVLIDTTRMTRNPLPCKGFRGRPCRAGTARSARRTIARPDSRRPGGRAVAARRSGRSRCADCVGCARANSHAPVRCAPSRTVAPQIDRGEDAQGRRAERTSVAVIGPAPSMRVSRASRSRSGHTSAANSSAATTALPTRGRWATLSRDRSGATVR